MANPELAGRAGFLKGLLTVLFTGIPSTQPPSVDLESVIADILGSRYVFISVGGWDNVVGAGRITADDWQQTVRLLTETARLIIFIPSDTPGCDWEAREIINRNLLNKTLFFMPPGGKERVWNETREGWSKLDVLLPYHDASGSMFFVNQTREVCWICPLSVGEHFTEIRHRIIALVDAGGLSEALDRDPHLARYVIHSPLSRAALGRGVRIGRALGLKVGRFLRRMRAQLANKRL